MAIVKDFFEEKNNNTIVEINNLKLLHGHPSNYHMKILLLNFYGPC